MLVVTPRPATTESLMGYVLRLTEANGYPTLSYVLASIHGHWYRAAVGRLDAEPLMRIAGITEQEVARLTLCPETRPRAYIRIHGTDLPSSEVSMRHPKVCPKCLAETGKCEAFWDLAQAVACPVHLVMLVGRCPSCESNLTWARRKVCECRCGADLTRIPTHPAYPSICDLMGVMRHLLYRDAGLAACPGGMQHLAHLDLRRLCKLLWVLSGTLQQRHEKCAAPKAWARARYLPQLERVAIALKDWPSGFQALLEELYEADVTAARELPAFLPLFSWLMVRLIKNDEDGGEAFAFLEREAYRYGARHWTRSAMSRKGGSSDLLPDTVRWGTISEAAEILSLHMATIKKLISAGEIKIRMVSGKKNRSILVDLDWARDQKHSRHPAVSIRDAAKRVGVSIETLKAMRTNGLYATAYRPTFPGSLALEDVEALRARLCGLLAGKVVARGSDVITLDRGFVQFSASAIEKAEIYGRLLERPDWVAGRQVKGTGIGRLQVRTRLLESLLDSFRGKDGCLTAQAAAKRLSCTAAVITGLKRSGYLECREHLGRVMPTTKSVREFERNYEAVSTTAERIGVCVKRIYARVDLSSVEHIRVKTTQHTTIFVHRKSIKRMERLCAVAGWGT